MVLKSNNFDTPFFEEYLREKRHLADATVDSYMKTARQFLSSNPDLESLESYNEYLVNNMIKKRKNHCFSALKNFIKFKIEDAALRNKLIEGMIKPPARYDVVQERKYLTEEQLIELLNAFEYEKHRVLALIQITTGVRSGDVLNLKRSDVVPEEYEGKQVLRLNITGKRKKRNVVYIHDEIAQRVVMNYITRNFNHKEYCFIEMGKYGSRVGSLENHYNMKKMNYTWFWEDLKKALNMVGIHKDDFATHDFRRCFARRVWEKYKDVHILQGLMNHSDPKTTMRYLNHSGMKNIDYFKEMQD